MKVYFEDGILYEGAQKYLGCKFLINAGVGYTMSEWTLEKIRKEEPEASVYTNSLIALDNRYCWNEELKVPELYLKTKTGDFVRVDELTDREIHRAHNLMAMYRNGAFKD